MQYILKILLSAALLVAVSEIAKRSSIAAAILASLPLTSVLAFVWMKVDGAPDASIAMLSLQIAALVIPSLALFFVLWWLLKVGQPFWLSLSVSCAATAMTYLLTLPILKKFGLAS